MDCMLCGKPLINPESLLAVYAVCENEKCPAFGMRQSTDQEDTFIEYIEYDDRLPLDLDNN